MPFYDGTAHVSAHPASDAIMQRLTVQKDHLAHEFAFHTARHVTVGGINPLRAEALDLEVGARQCIYDETLAAHADCPHVQKAPPEDPEVRDHHHDGETHRLTVCVAPHRHCNVGCGHCQPYESSQATHTDALTEVAAQVQTHRRTLRLPEDKPKPGALVGQKIGR